MTRLSSRRIVPMTTVVGLAFGVVLTIWQGAQPSSALTGSPFTGANGFTVVAVGNASFGNVELEGSAAVGGDATFTQSYPVIHTSGLTPPTYS